MDAKIKELLTRLSFFAEDGMADKTIVEIAKQADALLLEVARKQNTQQPVAWLVERHAFRASPHGQDAEGHDWMEVTNEGEAKAFPVFTALPVPRDVLMAFGEAVRDAAKRADFDIGEDVDLAAIADRYASKVQTEPVNQQLLAALKHVTEEIQDLMSESEGVVGFHRNGDIATWGELEAGGRFERLSSLPNALATIAEAAQPVVNSEVLGETCIDGGKCHHQCADQCFRRRCCAPFSDYTGPWGYDAPQPASAQPVAVPDGYVLVPIDPALKQVNDKFVLTVLNWWWRRNNDNPENTLRNELEEAGILPDWFKNHWIYHQDRIPNFGVHSSDVAELIYRAMLSAAQKPEGDA